jgi:hypothetical protein
VAVDEAAAENGEERREHDDREEEVALVHWWRPFCGDRLMEIAPLVGARAAVCSSSGWTP